MSDFDDARKRLEAWPYQDDEYRHDLSLLLAEVDRLKAEVGKLHRLLQKADALVGPNEDPDIDEAHEILVRCSDANERAERAEAEVERLRKALRDQAHGSGSWEEEQDRIEAAREALHLAAPEPTQPCGHPLSDQKSSTRCNYGCIYGCFSEQLQRLAEEMQLDAMAEEIERLRAALQGIIANGHEQVENRAGDLYCVEACAACAADAALRPAAQAQEGPDYTGAVPEPTSGTLRVRLVAGDGNEAQLEETADFTPAAPERAGGN